MVSLTVREVEGATDRGLCLAAALLQSCTEWPQRTITTATPRGGLRPFLSKWASKPSCGYIAAVAAAHVKVVLGAAAGGVGGALRGRCLLFASTFPGQRGVSLRLWHS
jgi:hypothetical protein